MDQEFERLVDAAKPYASQSLNIEAVAAEVAEWCNDSGEPALYLSMQKQLADPKRFPLGVGFHRYDAATRGSQPVGLFDIERPDYDDNPEGFKGNHLVVAILALLKDEIAKNVRFPVEVFTSAASWKAYCMSAGYLANKEHRAIEGMLDDLPTPKASKPRGGL